jgi:uncharacterized protein involved in exopolysaccharide biosynthesis
MNSQATTSYTLRDLLHVLFRRKNHILSFFLTSVGLVTLVSLLMTPTYEAGAKLLVRLGREDVYTPHLATQGQSQPIYEQNREEHINSEIEILNSQFIAEQVIKRLGTAALYPELVETSSGLFSIFPSSNAETGGMDGKALLIFQKNLSVGRVLKSGVIDINFRHHNPKTAAAAVNVLLDAYMDRHLHVYQNTQSGEFFLKQTQVLEKQLKEAEESLQSFRKQHAVISPKEERDLLLKNEADLRVQLNQTESMETEATNRINKLGQQVAQTPKTIALEQGGTHNPEAISTLQERLVGLEIKEQEILHGYNKTNPLVKKMLQDVRNEAQIARQRLSEQEHKSYGSSRTGINTTYQRLEEDLLKNQSELEALKAKKKAQQDQLAEYQNKLQRINQVEMEYARLQEDVEANRKNFRLYSDKLEESRVSNAMDMQKIANVSLIDPALPPLKPVFPQKLLNVALAIVLGGIGGLGLAFLLEFLDNALSRDTDVERYLNLSVLASIPEIKP